MRPWSPPRLRGAACAPSPAGAIAPPPRPPRPARRPRVATDALRARPDADSHGRGAAAGRPRLDLRRHFTVSGVHPYDEIPWERRTASIAAEGGEMVFEQEDVE